MKLTVDASVHLNALNPAEEGSAASQFLIEKLHGTGADQGVALHEVVVPTLLVVEVAASTARIFDDTDKGIEVAEAVCRLPRQILVPVDDRLMLEAARLAAIRRLRGADAIYAAVAHRSGAALVSRDRQQLERLGPDLTVWKPEEALKHLSSLGEREPAGDQTGEEPASKTNEDPGGEPGKAET